MAQLATCPKCEHELLIPDEARDESWAKCPECRTFFQLKEASARELPAVVLVEADEVGDPSPGAPAADGPSAPTWNEELDLAPPTVGTDDLETEIAEPSTPAPSDELETAAERIDKWFKSAKTVSEVPSLSEATDPEATNEIEPVEDAGNNSETVDLSAASTSELDEDLEFEESASQSWGESNEMDNLLADFETPAIDDEPAAVAPFDEPPQAADRADTQHSSESDAAPAVSATARTPRRERSLVRMLVMVLVAGVIGTGAGYYALLWMRGKSADFLNLAQYLPQAMLPAEFQERPEQLARAPMAPAPATAEPEGDVLEASGAASGDSASASAENALADEPGATAAAATESPADRPEQAAFTATEDVASNEPEPDPYAFPSPEGAQAQAPGASEEALPSDEAGTSASGAAVIAPPLVNPIAFTGQDLRASLSAAQQAQPGLVAGDLSDGKEVQRAKGFSYSMLADLAQKLIFAQGDDLADAQQAALALYRETLSDAHTREEVAQILPKWVASRHRKHGGVFFAATMTNLEPRDGVTEAQAQLDTGQSIAVLLPSELAAELESTSGPVAIVGWIVENARQNLTAYDGAAEQAVWVGSAVALD